MSQVASYTKKAYYYFSPNTSWCAFMEQNTSIPLPHLSFNFRFLSIMDHEPSVFSTWVVSRKFTQFSAHVLVGNSRVNTESLFIRRQVSARGPPQGRGGGISIVKFSQVHDTKQCHNQSAEEKLLSPHKMSLNKHKKQGLSRIAHGLAQALYVLRCVLSLALFTTHNGWRRPVYLPCGGVKVFSLSPSWGLI